MRACLLMAGPPMRASVRGHARRAVGPLARRRLLRSCSVGVAAAVRLPRRPPRSRHPSRSRASSQRSSSFGRASTLSERWSCHQRASRTWTTTNAPLTVGAGARMAARACRRPGRPHTCRRRPTADAQTRAVTQPASRPT
jgi:hypothetical protein